MLAALAAFPLVYLAAHFIFRASVAYAIAFAPNGGGIAGTQPTQEATPDGFMEVQVPVGPPRATIHAWMSTPSGRGTLVLLHGLRQDHRSLLGFAQRFVTAGYRVVLVDLRGHGRSSGTHLTYGQLEARDVKQVLDALKDRIGTGPVGVFGYSYGGAVALHLAAQDERVVAVVTLSSFATMRKVVVDYEHRYFPGVDQWLPSSWVDDAVDDAGWLGAFDPEASPACAAARVHVPLLVVHGAADTQVPPEHAAILTRSAGAAELVLLSAETHESVLQDRGGVVAAKALGHFSKRLRRPPAIGF